MRVLLDANILFSAAKSDGAVRELLHLLLEHGHDCRVDEYVVIEARRNLAAKDPPASIQLDALLKRLHVSAAQAPGPELRLVNWLLEKDRAVLAARQKAQRGLHRKGNSVPSHGFVIPRTLHSEQTSQHRNAC